MVADEGFSEDCDDLRVVGMTGADVSDDFEKRGKMVGFEFECVDEIVEGSCGVVVLVVDDSKQVIDGVGAEVD